jgi:hypothetical protein
LHSDAASLTVTDYCLFYRLSLASFVLHRRAFLSYTTLGCGNGGLGRYGHMIASRDALTAQEHEQEWIPSRRDANARTGRPSRRRSFDHLFQTHLPTLSEIPIIILLLVGCFARMLSCYAIWDSSFSRSLVTPMAVTSPPAPAPWTMSGLSP